MRKLLKSIFFIVVAIGVIGAFSNVPMFGKRFTGKAKCSNHMALFEVNHHFLWLKLYSDWEISGAPCS